MTAEEFLERYPDSEANSFNLEDMACDHCGNRLSFIIDIRSYATVYDHRQDDARDMGEWDRDSWCRCQECDESSDVRGFTIRGLDALIRKRREKPVRVPQPEDQHFL